MTNIPEFNFPAFASATKRLRKAGYHVTSPHEITEADSLAPGERSWEEYLRADLIKMLTHAEGLAVLSGHEKSRGARLEVSLAVELSMPVHPVDVWLLGAKAEAS